MGMVHPIHSWLRSEAGVETPLQWGREGAEGESGSVDVGQEREKQNTVLTGSWTEAWSGPCTTGVSDPRPWSSRQEQMGPQEHPRKVGRGAGLGRSGPHGTGRQGGGGLGLPLVQ